MGRSRFLKIAGVVLSGIGAGSLLLRTFLYYYLGRNRPNAPHPEAGYTFPLNTHGSVVYLDNSEHLLMMVLLYGVIIAGGLGMMFLVLHQRRRGNWT